MRPHDAGAVCRRALLAATPLVACGPDSTTSMSGGAGDGSVGSASIDGSGDASSTVTTASGDSGMTASTTGATTSSDEADLGSESTWGSPDCPDIHDGDLTITDVTDVETLRSTYRVRGFLYINETTLENLEFLSCLERIDGSLTVKDNVALTSLAGLERLESVADPETSDSTINVTGNAVLANLESLSAIQELFRLRIAFNDSLTSLGLNSLERLQDLEIGYCHQEGESASGNNPSLTEIDGLESLQLLRDLHIGSQESLVSLGSLHELATTGEFSGTAYFYANTNLHYDEIQAFDEAADGTVSSTSCGNLGDPWGPCELCPIK